MMKAAIYAQTGGIHITILSRLIFYEGSLSLGWRSLITVSTTDTPERTWSEQGRHSAGRKNRNLFFSGSYKSKTMRSQATKGKHGYYQPIPSEDCNSKPLYNVALLSINFSKFKTIILSKSGNRQTEYMLTGFERMMLFNLRCLLPAPAYCAALGD